MQYSTFKYVLVKLCNPREQKVCNVNNVDKQEKDVYKKCIKEVVTEDDVLSNKKASDIFKAILDKEKTKMKTNNFYAIINFYTGLMCDYIYYVQKSGQVKILTKSAYLDRMLKPCNLKIKK